MFIHQQFFPIENMNLLGNSNAKAAAPETSIKQTLLNEEIDRLRQVYQESSDVLEKVITTLKKIMNFRKIIESKSQVDVIHYFLEELSSMQDSFISLIQNSESDRQIYACSVMFRDSQKSLDSLFFKKMMKNHQDFKNRMNKVILKLQKDIQTLEGNNFHIYDNNPKPNNVLNSLKKNNLQKYVLSLTQIQTITLKMKNHMSNKTFSQKKSVRTCFKSDLQKYKDYLKNIGHVNMKEKLTNSLLIQEINNLKAQTDSHKHKIKKIEESIRINQKILDHTQIQTLINQQKTVDREDYRQLMSSLQTKVNSLMIVTPHLYRPPKGRSKSCHPIVVSTAIKQNKIFVWNKNDSQSLNMLGGDFLQQLSQV